MFPTVYNIPWGTCIYRRGHVPHGISEYIPWVGIYAVGNNVYKVGSKLVCTVGNTIDRGCVAYTVDNNHIRCGQNIIYRGWQVIYRGWYGLAIYRGLHVCTTEKCSPLYITLYHTVYNIVTHGISPRTIHHYIPWTTFIYRGGWSCIYRGGQDRVFRTVYTVEPHGIYTQVIYRVWYTVGNTGLYRGIQVDVKIFVQTRTGIFYVRI